MRVYVFQTHGVFLYAYSVVIAENEEQARDLCKAQLDEGNGPSRCGLEPKLLLDLPIEKSFGLIWNGDY